MRPLCPLHGNTVPNLPVNVTGAGLTTGSATGYAHTGRWIRKGRAIVVLGA